LTLKRFVGVLSKQAEVMFKGGRQHD